MVNIDIVLLSNKSGKNTTCHRNRATRISQMWDIVFSVKQKQTLTRRKLVCVVPLITCEEHTRVVPSINGVKRCLKKHQAHSQWRVTRESDFEGFEKPTKMPFCVYAITFSLVSRLERFQRTHSIQFHGTSTLPYALYYGSEH